ncbi:MAG: hypothetical protein LJE67_07970 [Salaquimonas sp.]|jgi:hypothetical protein|nr:hypothetical protein [Salaquimonas sp.]
MTNSYNPTDHYWIVGDDGTRAYSSRRRCYVPGDDEEFRSWQEKSGKIATSINTETELWDALADAAPQALPDDAIAQDRLAERQLKTADRVLLELAFFQENRLRALEGKDTITRNQFRDTVKKLAGAARARPGSSTG